MIIKKIQIFVQSLKWAYGEFKTHYWLTLRKDALRRKIESLQNKKIVVGAGKTNFVGWINTEVSIHDITSPNDWEALFEKNSIDCLLAEHVWEHLTLKQGREAIALCYQYLKHGGSLRIAVPDGFFPDEQYIAYVIPGGTGSGAADHKILYNYQLLQTELKKAGFKTELLEYWDETGKFHFNNWEVEPRGMVNRSKRFDERNKGQKIKYSSLIIDAIK